mgnify:CR=1 FL=1
MLLNNGDCIEVMQRLIDDGVQVDSVVTDPPYHLTSIVERFGKEGSAPAQEGTDGAFARASKGFLGKEWDGGDIAFRKETWELAYKLLKPGGHLLAFSASRIFHRMAVAIEDAGFEIRDQIMWIYGSGFPKSLNLGDGWGTTLKPAHEPIVMAKKRLEGTNKQNKDKYGTGGINIDGCRIEGEVNRPPTNPSFRDVAKEALARGGLDKLSFGQDRDRPIKRKKVDSKIRVRKAGSEFGQNSGWNNHKNVDTIYDPSKGRFPANVMHDGSEVVQDIFPSTKTTYVSKHHANNRTTESAVGELGHPGNQGFNDEGSASRYFYCPKVSKSERNNADKNTHPTVKPVELMKYLCRLVTPKGGTVLDPFMGSGSTGMAAKDEGFDFIGIEKEKEYFDICQSRIKKTAPLMDFMT